MNQPQMYNLSKKSFRMLGFKDKQFCGLDGSQVPICFDVFGTNR